MKTVSMKLPDALDRKISDVAKRRKTTRSEIIREALEAFTSRPGRSVSVAASDLVGALRGPRDLSSSDRHLTGYGE